MKTENIIFYFSGTGNTKWAAGRIAQLIGDCEVVSIAGLQEMEPVVAKRVGIFYPVYYWGLPNIIREFVSKATFQAEYVYELHTMGGYDGVAACQLEELLSTSGCRLNASFSLKMPNNVALISKNNFFSDAYRIPDDKKITGLIRKADVKLTKIAEIVTEQKEHPHKEPVVTKPYHQYGYRMNEQNCATFKDKGQKFAAALEESCIGCGKCSAVCPKGNIKMVAGKPVWGTECEFCLACLHSCPQEAINCDYSKGKKRYHFPIAENADAKSR